MKQKAKNVIGQLEIFSYFLIFLERKGVLAWNFGSLVEGLKPHIEDFLTKKVLSLRGPACSDTELKAIEK